jgi:hypothetical protein
MNEAEKALRITPPPKPTPNSEVDSLVDAAPYFMVAYKGR